MTLDDMTLDDMNLDDMNVDDMGYVMRTADTPAQIECRCVGRT